MMPLARDNLDETLEIGMLTTWVVNTRYLNSLTLSSILLLMLNCKSPNKQNFKPRTKEKNAKNPPKILNLKKKNNPKIGGKVV